MCQVMSVFKVAEMKEVLLVKSKEWISQLESSSKETVEARNELNQEQENCKRKVWKPQWTC